MVDGTKKKILTISKRLVPGTVDISHCSDLEYCMSNNRRSCGDIRNLCIPCRDDERIIGGISFIFGLGSTKDKKGIVVYRYGQEGSYATMIEGDGIEDIMEKFDKDKELGQITERTTFIKKERHDVDDLKIIEAFKRYIDQSRSNLCILVTKKNSSGEYEDLDKELIKIAEEAEKNTGKIIKIIDQSEIDRNIYLLGIFSKEILQKLKLEVKTITDVEHRIHISIIPVSKVSSKKDVPNYVGILLINSIDDDVVGTNDVKDEWKKFFTEKYNELRFIGSERIEKERVEIES